MTEQYILDDKAMDLLFREARTYNGWLDKTVPDVLLKAIHDLVKWAPTSANCSPMRLVFIKTNEAKERLKPYLMDGNIDKTMSAPAIALIAQDMKFFDQLPKLFPHADARSWFAGNDEVIQSTATRNSTLQAGYLIMAARALGLDCGPMSGFDEEGVNKEFFSGTDYEINFICNLGYGDKESLFPRSPRFEFDEIAEII